MRRLALVGFSVAAMIGFACGSDDAVGHASESDAGDDGSMLADGLESTTEGGAAKEAPWCLTDHWCWDNPAPQGFTLHAVHGTAADDVWACGDRATLIHFDGKAWTKIPAQAGSLRGAWATAKDNAWFVGDEGTILRWDGAKVERVSGIPALALTQVWATSATDAWAIGDRGPDLFAAILHWDGQAWTKSWSAGSANIFLVALGGTGPKDLWAAWDGAAGVNVTMHYDGTSWTEMGSQDEDKNILYRILGFWGSAATGETWMVSRLDHSAGPIRLFKWSGSAWSAKATLDGELLREQNLRLDGTASDDIWIGDRHYWDGKSLRTSTDLDTVLVGRSIRTTSRGEVWNVGLNGVIAHHANGKWERMTRGVVDLGVRPRTRNGYVGGFLTGTGIDDVWNVGPVTAHFDGAAWKEVIAPSFEGGGTSPGYWVSGFAVSKSEVWLVDLSGNVTRGDGTTWAPVGEPRAARNGPVWVFASNDAWSAAAAHWDGTAWTGANVDCVDSVSGNRVNIYGGDAIFATGPSDLWLGTEDGVYRIGGTTGQKTCTRYAPVKMRAFAGRANDLWAVGDGGRAYHFDGQTFTEVQTGTTSPLTGVWAAGPSDVWAASGHRSSPDFTTSSALLHWDGVRWSKVSGITDVASVWGVDASHVWAAGGDVLLRYAP